MSKILTTLDPSNLFSFIPSAYRSPLEKALFYTGLTWATWSALSCSYRAASTLLAKETNLIARYGVDSWAIITGATDGIGKEFAVQLARRGFNIVLVGRNQDKLGVVRSEIILKYPNVKVQIVVADFLQSAQEGFYERILEQVKDLDISILINNVGVSILEEYHNIKINEIRGMVLVNCMSQALMTRIFLPKLQGRVNDKHKSAIINLSSISAEAPSPYFQLYGASKIFNDYLSKGLSYEYPDLDIISLRPAFTSSNITEQLGVNAHALPTSLFVESSLKYLGKRRDTNGHWSHQWKSYIGSLLPTSLVEKIVKESLFAFIQSSRQTKIKS